MKRKQKKILMFSLCGAAVVALVVQLGPFVFGKPNPYADPAKAKQAPAGPPLIPEAPPEIAPPKPGR